MNLRTYLSTVVAATFFWFSGLSHAQNQAAADALFRSAQAAAEAGDWRTACDRFEESLRLEPAPGTILNIARCREKLGQWSSAWNRYSEVTQKVPAGDTRGKFAEKKATEILPKVPHVVLVAPKTELKVTVHLGSVEVSSASFGVPLPVDPGAITVTVDAEGHEPWTTTVDVVEAAEVSVGLEIGPEKAAPTALETTSKGAESTPSGGPEAKSGGSAWPYVSLAGGGLLLGAGVLLQFVAAGEHKTVEQNCIDRECNRIGYDASQRGATAQTLEMIAFGAGAALAGLGVYLILSEDHDDKKSTQVGVRPTTSGALLTFEGTL